MKNPMKKQVNHPSPRVLTMEGKMRLKTFWAIRGVHGFYTGTFFTRSAAILEHCCALGPASQKDRTWRRCRAKGDRAVEVVLVEVAKGKKS
jgi:hypothetical protein